MNKLKPIAWLCGFGFLIIGAWFQVAEFSDGGAIAVEFLLLSEAIESIRTGQV